MSLNERTKLVMADRSQPWSRWAGDNVVRYLALLGRHSRHCSSSPWRAPRRLTIGTVTVIAAVAVTMSVLDGWAIVAVQQLPGWLIFASEKVTDFGKSVRFLVPIALVLAAMAALAPPGLPRMSQRVLAAVAVRLGFMFLAVGLPGLLVTIVKRLIGRGRPLVEGAADPFLYRPLRWAVEYASLPSGHATDAFAIAAAIGALWPRTRPLMWTYAVVIALSRVVLTAHFPSDVMAGAVVGTLGALLVREWFAARGLAFVRAADGRIRPMPGPSLERIKRVVGQLIAS
jgi:membrane-associated phospholipid phosphatase